MARDLEANRFTAFGLDLHSEIELPGEWRAGAEGAAPLSLVTADDLGEPVEPLAAGWAGTVDGHPFVAQTTPGGHVWMRWGERWLAHLLTAERRLEVPASIGSRPAELRVAMDSVLFTAALALGAEALHAGAVTTPHGALAVCGVSGAGKTSFASALRRAGCEFLTDDVLVLRRGEDALLAFPGPPVANVALDASTAPGEDELATLDDERWVAVRGATEPVPLAGLVVLGAAGDLDWRAPLAHLLRYPDAPDRAAARFDLAMSLASEVPMRGVEARSAPPDELAAEALAWLEAVSGSSPPAS